MRRTKEEIQQCLESGVKTCHVCKCVKPHEDFCKDKNSADGLNSICRDCISAARSQKRIPQRTKEMVAYDIESQSKVCSICKKRYSFNMFVVCNHSPDKKGSICSKCALTYHRESNIRGYGISIEEYDRMKKEQGSKCAICGRGGHLYVDHNHKTGEVRGLLCNSCNSAIGQLQDSPVVVAKALRYLTERGCYGEE
ncbi:MAG: endonuclease VII domain-containing protein [Bacilli bacterium]